MIDVKTLGTFFTILQPILNHPGVSLEISTIFSTQDWVRVKLDRAFATNSWWHLFPLCTLSVSHAIISDHDPIKLELVNTSVSKKYF